MAITLNVDQYHLQNQLNITTSRMRDYSDKSIDEIIEAEASSGNKVAKDYGRKLFGSVDELIETFKLDSPTNKYNIINKMSGDQRDKVLEMLDAEDLVMGMNFFTQGKLEQMLGKVSVAEIAGVALEAFPLAKIISMIPDEQLSMFFMSDDVKKHQVAQELKNLDPELLLQMAESITGEAVDEKDIEKVLAQITSLPEKQFKEVMASMEPEIQQNIIYQMAEDDAGVMLNFPNQTYLDMLHDLQKPDLVKSMTALNQESLQIMTKQLPEDLFSIVATQIDTKQLAKFLIDRCPNLLEQFVSMGNASTIK